LALLARQTRAVRLERLFVAAGDLLFGAACHGCGEPSWGICPRCRAAVSSHGCFRTRPEPCPDGFPITVTTAPYDAIMRRLISAHKERGALGLTPFLSGRLAAAVGTIAAAAEAGSRPIVLVPVPSARSAVRRRGFDATWAMAAGAARRLRGDCDVRAGRLLAQLRPVQDQAGLGATERAANLRGGFRATSAAGEALVIIVDDVVTTGASLSEAARALRVAGVPVLAAATVAATERRTSARQPRQPN
jgi:predicted amidophosphoribosyltransferase